MRNNQESTNNGTPGFTEGARRTCLLFPAFACLLPLLFILPGCGAVNAVGLKVSSAQLRAGDLYSGDFYAAATPDEVRRAIAGRSLAGEERTAKEVIVQPAGPFGGELEQAFGLFVPNQRLTEERLTPLLAALRFSSDPQVIRVLLDAGAVPEWPAVRECLASKAYSYAANPRNRAIVELLLARADAQTRCQSVRMFAALEEADMLRYCFDTFPESRACMPKRK